MIDITAGENVSVSCNGGFVRVTVNGGPTDTSTACSSVTNLQVTASGNFTNTIDLTEVINPPFTALTSVTVNGGDGDDTITGSGFADNLQGGNGADTILGLAGADTMSGGTGNDSLNGGTGADTMSGDADNDTLIWNPGDGSDVVNGGADTDTLQFNGSGASEVFAVNSGGGGRVEFLRDVGAIDMDIGTTEILTVNALAGTDSMTVNDLSGVADLQTVNFNGGSDTDTLIGPDATNTWNITGSDSGNISGAIIISFATVENLTGRTGADTFIFSDGANVSGNIDGGAGTDTLNYGAYTTAVAANLGLGTAGLTATLGGNQEVPPTASAATGTATLSNYDPATKTFDITVTVSDLNPANVIGFHIHRAPYGVNGPIIVDFVPGGVPIAPLVPVGSGFTFTATGVSLATSLLGGVANEAPFLGGITYVNIHTPTSPGGEIRGQVFSTGNVNLSSGTATGTNGISNIENATGGSANDSLVGNFSVNNLQGNAGNDTLVGGPGNDTLQGGANDDVLVWSNGDGTDVIDGQTGTDTVQVNGALGGGALNDSFTVVAGPGGRVDFDRISTGPFSLDIGTVETLTVNGISGDDTFAVNSLAGVSDLTQLNLNGVDGNDIFNLIAAATVTINVNGGLPTTPGGDTLTYNAEGRTFSGDITPPDGQIVSPGVQNVNFQQLEAVNVINAAVDLFITKSDTPDPVTAGSNLTYTLTATNSGPGDAQNISLVDVIPANTTFVSYQQNSGPAFTLTTPPVGGTGTVTATLANFASGASATFTLTLNVNANTPNGSTITNTATLSSTSVDSNPANNSDTETTSVNTSADLSVIKTDSPDPVAFGANLTYTITVTNSGPSNAQAVTLSDVIPANTTFVSFTAPAGWISTTPPVGGTGTVTATNPTVAAGSVSVFTLVVNVNSNPSAAAISNTATVSSTTTDPNTVNNAATATTALPSLSINDVSVSEGNSGSVNAIFTVTLSGTVSQTVTVDFFTANGTATEPGDFTAVNGTITFPSGQTSRTITVPVNGDTLPEGDETFLVNLTNPTNAPILDGQGIGTIIDDDPGGTLQFSASTYSANESVGLATITINRTGSTLGTITVNFTTSNGTASSGSDYGLSAGTLTFAPGETSQTFTVPIIDDTTSEGTETVNLALSGPTGGATLGSQSTAVLLILDNEPPPANSVNVFAVTVNNNLVSFNSAAPETILNTLPITGLQSGETLLVIDFRPATGQLFGVGSSNRVYSINTTTGAATAVAGAFTPTLIGTDFGGDFNPTVDRLRVVSDLDQNLRLNPATGSVAAIDNPLTYAAGDANFGANPNAVASAYTNSFAGSTTTTLYNIDSNLDTLVLQGSPDGAPVSPNTGLLTTVGALGVNTTGLVGLDIQGSTNRAVASMTSPGDSSSKFYNVNLSSGAATLIGTIGGPELIRDIAVAAGSIQFSAATANVSEDGGHVTLTVTRTGNTSIPAEVNFATIDGTAVQRTDFIVALGVLQFAAGETSKSIDILIVDDV
jgi:uncharacterized repeat protein (TIGR01451 family)